MLLINFGATGLEGVNPRLVQILTDSNHATITAAGWLNQTSLTPNSIYPTDYIAIRYNVTTTNPMGNFDFYIPTINAQGIITLSTTTGTGDVTYNIPSVTDFMAVWSNTTGNLKSGGADVTNPGNLQLGIDNVPGILTLIPPTNGFGAFRIKAADNVGNFLAELSHTAIGQSSTYTLPDPGTANTEIVVTNKATVQEIDSLVAIIGDHDLSIGNSTGDSGSLIIFSATATSGALHLAVNDNAGDFVITLANAPFGQTTEITIPDPDTATANLVIAPAAFVDKELIKADGSTGKVSTIGAFPIASITASWGGGGTSNAFVATGLTTGSIVTANISTSANAVSITKIVPTANTLTVDFSADPGAGTTVFWSAWSAAVA